MTKKIFAISTLLLVLVVGAIFVYNFAFKKPSAPQNKTETANKEEGKLTNSSIGTMPSAQKESANASITAVSDEPVFGAALSPDGNSIYFFLKGNGQLNQTDLSGKLVKVLSTKPFEGIKKVSWCKLKDKAVVKTETAGKAKFFVSDLVQKKTFPVKDNTDSVALSNFCDKIIYKYYDPKTKKRTVSLADPDGKNWKDLSDFDYYAVEIAPVPESAEISFWPGSNAFTATSANIISLNGGEKKEILKDRFGADLLWAPNGTRAILSASDQKGGHKIDLYSMNSSGGQIQSLMFPTFASKCVWSSDSVNLFCALPGDIPESAVLPNDWQEGKISTSDTFWKVDTSSGKKDRLVDPEKIAGSFDAINLFLSQDEKSLFFVNKGDGKLYKLAI